MQARHLRLSATRRLSADAWMACFEAGRFSNVSGRGRRVYKLVAGNDRRAQAQRRNVTPIGFQDQKSGENMSWPWSRKVETRASHDDAVIAALLGVSSGSGVISDASVT